MTINDGDATILVRAKNEPWREPALVGYLNEAEMQTMLAEQPSLIPGVSHRALAAREFHTGVGPSDVVVVDQDGTLTVVECKLASNAEVRRKIIGQVLDYAARLWRMPLVDFDSRWKACSKGTEVLDLLEDQAAEELASALNDGAFRLVLAVDEINEDLRRIVEYLNAHTNDQVTVLAVELRRVSHRGVDFLTPRTFGAELARAKQDKAKTGKKPAWALDDVRTRLESTDPAMRAVFDLLNDELIEAGCEPTGTWATEPSMIYRWPLPQGKAAWPYAVYTSDNPWVQVNFHWLSGLEPQARERFLDTLSSPPASLDAAAIRASDFKKKPNVPFLVLLSDEGRGQFVNAIRCLAGPAFDQ